MPDLLDRLKTALADRYAIERELGAGGMATVYLAEDLKHHRPVAVKVLRPELAAVVGAERFLREIEVTANLHHPHILPLYDSGEADGFLYYVMPYVEGESLRDRLNREKQLPLNDALQFAREVADALSYAHSHDVIHRDIKPENILLEAGHAVIADFGIARAVTAAGGEKLTETGLAVGTPQYMSLEQSAGDANLDGRSDVYSLGCVLYEMLAGEPPYTGPTAQAIIAKRMVDAVPSVRRMRETIPRVVDIAITKALAKIPADRFVTAADFIESLNLTTPGQSLLSKRPRLVVLPFENLGPKDDEYFADGLTDELTARLAGVSGLAVIARQSAIQYKKSTKTPQQMRDELEVDYILEGTVSWQRSGAGPSRVRVRPQLINASEATHEWADVYDDDMTELFQVQTNIAQKVVNALNIVLLEPERGLITAKPSSNVEAYDYYLRGNDYFGRGWERKDFEIAIQMYQRAVELDQNFALAYAKMAAAHTARYWFKHDRTDECLDDARNAVDTALRINPDLPEAHVALGWYYYHGLLDYDRALEHFAIARRSRPEDSQVLFAIAAVQRRQGAWEQAASTFEQGTTLDPRNARLARELGFTYSWMRQHARAERYLDRAISLQPDWFAPYTLKAHLYLQWEGDLERAEQVLRDASKKVDPVLLFSRLEWIAFRVLLGLIRRDYPEVLGQMSLASFGRNPVAYYLAKALALSQEGQFESARALYDEACCVLEAKVDAQPLEAQVRTQLGTVYAALGRKEDAIKEGKKAVELLPVSKSAVDGAESVLFLAEIYVTVGEHAAAVEEIETALFIPSMLSVPLLRIDPIWDPLRDNPRFQALLAKYEN